MQNQGGNNLPGLITATPFEGRQLAIKLARRFISDSQQDAGLRKQLKDGCVFNSGRLIADAPGEATYCKTYARIKFQEIAKANNYWRNKD